MTLILLLFPHPSLSRPLPSTSVSHDRSMDQRGHRHSSGSSALSRIDTEFLSRCRQRWQIISKNNTPWIRPSISSVTFMSMSIFYWIHGVHVRTFSYWFLSKLKLQSNRNGLKFLFSVLFWSANNKTVHHSQHLPQNTGQTLWFHFYSLLRCLNTNQRKILIFFNYIFIVFL